MSVLPGGEGFSEELSPEELESVNSLSSEYRNHMRRREGSSFNVQNGRPIEEVTIEIRNTLDWLLIDDIDEVNERNVKSADGLVLDYTSYDVEDIFFIVQEARGQGDKVKFADIANEHKETDLLSWRKKQNKLAADFLILHGVDEKEINNWKGIEGTGRQQRAMRRMHWLLREPFMAQFTNYLEERATSEKPLSFKDMATSVMSILEEQWQVHGKQITERDSWVPRRQDEYDITTIWLQRAINVCQNVFIKDYEDGVYGAAPAE